MSEPTQKCEKNAIFNQNYAQKLLLLLKWPILAVLAKGEISIFQISSKKKFYNIDCWSNPCISFIQMLSKGMTSSTSSTSLQRKLTIRERIPVQLVSSFTTMDSTAFLPTNNHMISYLVKSNLFKLDTNSTVIFPLMVSGL